MKLREFFEQAQSQPEALRAAWLEENCADLELRAHVHQLLNAHQRSVDPLRIPVEERLSALDQPKPSVPEDSAEPLRRIGAFQLLRVIGQGGMATVYLAEHSETHQRVAVKLLHKLALSELDLQLFQRERKALASLEHANVARLIDGGVTAQNEPYLVMEYVEGVLITEFVKQRALSPQQTVQLLIDVCNAVAAAHTQLIVHRDLKPSNVLVRSDAQVKLLDFGIAKLLSETSDLTEQGLIGMTPSYAAPEQFNLGSISTATDVYSLGILMHELLLGAKPKASQPVKPSSLAINSLSGNARGLAKFLRGDMDTVILKCLEEDPLRRYQSAAELAQELQRLLANEPINAHPPSKLYRIRKFVTKHRGGVAVSALTLTVIFASLVVALWQAQEAKRAQEYAFQQAARAKNISQFMVSLLEKTAPDGPQSKRPDVPTLIRTAAQALPDALEQDLSSKIELTCTLGVVLRRMGAETDALQLLQSSFQLAKQLPLDDPLRSNAQFQYARSLFRDGQNILAEQLLEEVATLADEKLPKDLNRTQLLKLQMAISSAIEIGAKTLTIGEAMLATANRACTSAPCETLAFAENDFGVVLLEHGLGRRARALLESSLRQKIALKLPLSTIANTQTYLAQLELYRANYSVALDYLEQSEANYKALGDSVIQNDDATALFRVRKATMQGEYTSTLERARALSQSIAATPSNYCRRALVFVLIANAELHLADSEFPKTIAKLRTFDSPCRSHDEGIKIITEVLNARFDFARSGKLPSEQLMRQMDDFEKVISRSILHEIQWYREQALELAIATRAKQRVRQQANALVKLLTEMDVLPSHPLLKRATAVLSEPIQ